MNAVELKILLCSLREPRQQEALMQAQACTYGYVCVCGYICMYLYATFIYNKSKYFPKNTIIYKNTHTSLLFHINGVMLQQQQCQHVKGFSYFLSTM